MLLVSFSPFVDQTLISAFLPYVRHSQHGERYPPALYPPLLSPASPPLPAPRASPYLGSRSPPPAECGGVSGGSEAPRPPRRLGVPPPPPAWAAGAGRGGRRSEGRGVPVRKVTISCQSCCQQDRRLKRRVGNGLSVGGTRNMKGTKAGRDQMASDRSVGDIKSPLEYAGGYGRTTT